MTAKEIVCEWDGDTEGKIICVVLYSVRCSAVAATCHILAFPRKPCWTPRARLEKIYLLLQDEDFAQNAILHFIQYVKMDET